MKRGIQFLAAALIAATSPVFCSESCAVLYTSTRSVSGFAAAADGTLWAATRGGVLHRDNSGRWQKFTEADGLPSSEALGIAAEGDTVRVSFGGKSAVYKDQKWLVKPDQFKPGKVCSIEWNGAIVASDLTDCRIRTSKSSRSIGLPKSTGSHISALLSKADKLWAAMFGDGIWQYDGKCWSPVKIGLPNAAKEITSMTQNGDLLFIGTRREGIWEYDGKSWKQILQPNEPANANIQNAVSYKGKLFFSTLEDGIVVKAADAWKQYRAPEISSDAPRQMVEFQGMLYVRHGSGKVDRFNGSVWDRDIFAGLPRKQVSALAASDKRLYLAQWEAGASSTARTGCITSKLRNCRAIR